MNDPRLLELLEAYLENSIGEPERGELQDALRQSPSARRLFWEYLQQHAMIGEILAEAQGRQLALEEGAPIQPAAAPRLHSALKKSLAFIGTGRWRWAGLAAASLLLAVLLIQLFQRAGQEQADLLVLLEEVQGDVYLATETGEVRAERGRVVRPGEQLKTGSGSLVVLRYADSTRLELRTDTRVRLLASDRAETTGKQVFLEQGEVLAEVVPQPEGRPLLLSTSEAEARVLGTRFRSLALAGATRIELEEGQLLVTRKRDRQSVEVPSGMFVVAGANDHQALKPVPLPARIARPRTLLVSRGEPLIAAAYAADGRLVTVSGDGWIGTYEFANRVVPLHFHDASARHVRAAAVSPDGKLVAAGGTDGRVKVRDAAIGHTRTLLDNYAIDIDPKAVGGDGKLLFNAKHIQFRSTPGGLAFAPDGKSLAVVERVKTGCAIKLYDSASWKQSFTLPAQTLSMTGLTFAPEGKLLAAADQEGVTLWDLVARRQRHRLEGSAKLRTLAFSPDGRWLAGAGDDGKLQLWSAQSGRPGPSFPGLFRRCYALAFSPDGRMLATAHEGHATLWDVVGRRELATFTGHSLAIFALSFAPDGRTLATAGWERYVRLWDISDEIRNKLSRPEAAAALSPPLPHRASPAPARTGRRLPLRFVKHTHASCSFT